MDVEVVKSELVPVSVESGSEENSSLLHEKENGTLNQETGLNEPIKFGSHGMDEPVDREGSNIPVADFPKDVGDEWPEPKQIHSFYLVKYRTYEDPKLKAKVELADKDQQKKNQAKFQISDKFWAKKAERSRVIELMRPLNDENRQYWNIVNGKRKEMEPLHEALGKLRNTNSVNREKGVGICSSEEELNYLIKSLEYRIQHESIPLSEEKKILKEIKQLEGTREKVLANAAMRAKIQDSMGEKDVIQDQVKLMGVDLDGVRKEQQVVKAKIKQLTDEKEVLEKEINSLADELDAATEKYKTAYKTFSDLKQQLNAGNDCFYQSRTLLTKVRELAARKDIEALKEIVNMEVDKFMSLWNNNKAFRDDYERRILASLDNRQLSRDGRMRNPDEKPLVIREAPPSSSVTETATKTNVKQPKEDSTSAPKHNTSLAEKVQKEVKNKIQKEVKDKATGTTLELPIDVEGKGIISVSEKPQKDSQPKRDEVDEAKLKEIRREEEIAKAKQALERKKKLAEKAAAKAVIKAQKEAEKKLKDREKKAKKKAGASAPASEPEEQPTEADAEVTEPEKADEKVEASAPSKSKDRKENLVRYRNRPKGPVSVPRDILKRKKSTNYWVWAAPAGLSVMVLLVFGYKYFF
ncbi:unnamed protein product [Camellia sinensis]